MKDTQHGKIVFECDSCDEVLTTDTGEWAEARRMLDVEAWQARQIGQDWIHTCQNCIKGRRR